MTKYRIVEKQYDDGSRTFRSQYFMGNEDLKFTIECGFNSDGWINIGDEKDTYRKALLLITNRKRNKIKFISVLPTINLIKTILHEVD